MKIQILNLQGNKTKELETGIFDGKVRKDILQRAIELEKTKQPYAPFYLAGKQASASGKIRHGRRRWKTAAGKGISRIPRKIFWRRGTQFYWQGATIASTRGGRRAHPPKILSMLNKGKINKKEKNIAFLSALALTSSLQEVKAKYKSLEDKKIDIKLPIITEDKILEIKTKQFLEGLKKILDGFYEISIQKKSVRAGKGKSRGRKYRKTAGMLLVIGNTQNKKIKGIEIKKVNSLRVSDLASGGARIVIYTEQAIADLEKKIKGKIKKEEDIKENKSKQGEKKRGGDKR